MSTNPYLDAIGAASDEVANPYLDAIDNRKGRLRSAGAAFMRGGGVGVGQSVSGAVRGAEAAINPANLDFGRFSQSDFAEAVAAEQPAQAVRFRTPQEREQSLQQDPVYQAGAQLAEGAREAFQPNPRFAGEFWTDTIPGSAGQMLPTVAAGAVNPYLAVLQYGLSAGQGQAEEAVAAGQPDKAQAAFVAAAPLGAVTEAALGPIARMAKLAKLARTEGAGRAVLEAAAREAGQEGLEQVGGNLIASDVAGYDPNRPWRQGVGTAMAAGAVLGGALGGGLGAVAQQTRDRVREQMGIESSPGDAQVMPDPSLDELPDYREADPAQAATDAAMARADAAGQQMRRTAEANPYLVEAGAAESVPAEGFTPIDQAVRQSRLGRMDPQAAVAEAVPAEGWTPVTSFIRREQMRPRPVTPETAAPVAGPTPEQRQASQEFDRLLIEIGPEAGWVDNLDALAPQMETAKQDATTITARLARGAELRKLRFRAAQAFGLDAAKMNLDVRDRAQLLQALQAYVEKVIVPQRQADSLTAAIQPEAGKQPVNTGDLAVGDVLNIDGEPVRVEAVDPDTGEVTLLDGTRFGRTTIADGQTIYVENVEAVQASTDFAPVEPVNSEDAKARSVADQSAIRNPQSAILAAPESVADQNARLEREAAQAKAKADRETLAERQAKPLTGSVGDIGATDMFDASKNDLFSAPAPKAKEQNGTEGTKQDVQFLKQQYQREQAAIAEPFIQRGGENAKLGQARLAAAARVVQLPDAEFLQYVRNWKPLATTPAKSAIETAIAALESLKVDTAGKVFDAIQGIPVAVWNGALSAAQLALRAGGKVADAIGAALAHIRAKHKAKFDEAAVRAELERDLLGEARFETGTALPDFQPYATAQRIFTKPFGAETLPWVGRLFGPRGKRFLSAVDRALVTWAAETYGVGKAVASSIGTEIKGRLDGVLKANDQGDLNVTPRTPGQSLKVADVLEALQRDPDSYVLTPAQRQAWERVLQPLLKRRAALVQRYGLATTEDADGNLLAYFPRIVTKMPQTPEDTTGGSGQRVGGKQGFQKARAFRTEAQGWAAGYEYETSIERRLVTAIERLYKAMADQRLAANPELQGRTRSEVVADLMEYHAEELGGGLMTEAEIQRQADSIMQRGGVNQPAFAGRTFARPRTDGGPGLDVSLKQELERAFPDSNSPVRDLIMKGNNFVKAIRLGFDLGASLTQGLPLFFRNPVTWGQATAKSFQALFSPEAFPRYLLRESNRQAARELAQLGSPVGSLPEMLAGLNRGELLDKVPVVAPLKNAFGRQFSTFMDVAKLELWKAHRELYPPNQWPELAQSLESLLLSGRMESAGVKRLQSNIERVALLAPSYYRGAVNLVSAAMRPGVSGHVARRALIHFGVGASVAFVGIGLSLGMSEDELKRRFNPQDPNFMQWRVSLPNGNVVNLGFGGMFRSWIRLLGNMVKTSLETPGDWLALDYQRNPLSRWLRGHLAPVPAFALDAFSGRDFMGRQTDLTDIGEQVIPLWMVALIPKTGKVPPGKLELAASWTGLSGFAQTPMQYIRTRASEFNRTKLGPQPRFMPEESQYARLEWALRMNNLDAARKEYEALVIKLTPAPGKTPQRMVLEHFRQQAADGTFAKYRAHEAEFRRSLLPHEQEIYRLAREEQRALYPRLRTALRATQ